MTKLKELQKKFHQDDKVKERGGYETGLVTGFNGTHYRVFWNSSYNMYHEFEDPDYLTLVECPHE